jgi:hypothetical protein
MPLHSQLMTIQPVPAPLFGSNMRVQDKPIKIKTQRSRLHVKSARLRAISCFSDVERADGGT